MNNRIKSLLDNKLTGAICLKDAATALFNWVVDNGYFNKVKFCAFVHD